jgi:CheY-like chemotaxis protein
VTAIYKVECPSCGRPFNAMSASPCDCIDRARSLRCPNCAACFCRAPQKFKTEFWAHAPRELYARVRAVTAPADEPNPAPADTKRPLVLFADDDASGRAIARRVVTAAGFGVVVAASGDEALRLALDYAPDLVIADAFMPGMDGRDVARAVKADLPETRVVIISGVYRDPRYKHEAMRDFEVDDYVAKPLSPADLRALMAKHLRR